MLKQVKLSRPTMVEPVKSLNTNVGKVWLMSGLLSLTLWQLPFLLGKYVDVTFPYIAQEDIVRELVGVTAVDKGNKKDLCPALSPHLQDSPHLMSNDIVALAEEVVARDNQVQPGGIWEPKDCKARYRLVLIVPYRNRSDHLQQFLTYMHPFLQRQQLSYRIVVVEQSKEKSFNRAKLFNIGFVESQKVAKEVECFIFHDVDLLPRHDYNIYSCTHNPRHMYSAVDVFRYHLPYREIMGGVMALQRSHIVAMNGFSNRFYGWGAEDDDLAQRIHQLRFTLTRFDPAVASYVTLSHQSETPAPDRFTTLSQAKENMKKDGLNSLNYEVKKQEERSLYTWLLVSC